MIIIVEVIKMKNVFIPKIRLAFNLLNDKDLIKKYKLQFRRLFLRKNMAANTLKFPFEFHELPLQLHQELKKYFRGIESGFIQVGPKKWFMPKSYEQLASDIYNFKVRPNDVWIVTYPRSGTTVTQEMTWLIANNLDYETASNILLNRRFPFLELQVHQHPDLIEQIKNEQNSSPEKVAQIENAAQHVTKRLKVLEMETGRRFIKTHLPFSLLPPDLLEKGCKIIYIARNPLDVAVSNYHHNISARAYDYVGNFEEFWKIFKNDYALYSPYWTHIEEGWKRRHEKNFLFLFYENMNANLQETIKTVAKFLDKPLTTEQVHKLEIHLRIDNFRNNRSVNNELFKELGYYKKGTEGLIRNGKCGNWKSYFNDEEIREVEDWVLSNQRTIGINFKF